MAETKKTNEICEEIIERIANGEPLRQICRDEHMPAWRTVYDWIDEDSDLAARIARARETGYDEIANRLRDTARGRGESTSDVQRDKLIVETDLKLLAKWSPKRYGDKISTEISGPDGKPVETKTEVTINFVRPTPKP